MASTSLRERFEAHPVIFGLSLLATGVAGTFAALIALQGFFQIKLVSSAKLDEYQQQAELLRKTQDELRAASGLLAKTQDQLAQAAPHAGAGGHESGAQNPPPVAGTEQVGAAPAIDYSAFPKYDLVINYSDDRKKEALMAGKVLGRHFRQVTMANCARCLNLTSGKVIYPVSSTLRAATDLADFLASQGMREFSDPLITSSIGNRFSVEIR